MTLFIEVIGWASALVILTAYLLISTGRLTGQSATYQVMNVAGSAGFVVNLWWHGAIPSMVLNVVWCGIGLYALAGIMRARRSSD